MDQQEFMKHLSKYPGLQERIEEMMKIVGNEDGKVMTADEAEERTIVEVRKLGKELLLDVAPQRAEEVSRDYEKRADYDRDGKKNFTGKAVLEKSRSARRASGIRS